MHQPEIRMPQPTSPSSDPMAKPAAVADPVADPAAQAAMRSPRPAGHGAVRAYDWLAHHAANRPAKEAVRELSPRHSYSYADLDQRAEALAVHLQSLGIARGDRVALLAHNGVEYLRPAVRLRAHRCHLRCC